MLQTTTLLRNHRSRCRSRSPSIVSSNASHGRPDETHAQDAIFPNTEHRITRQRTFIDLTRPDDDGQAGRPDQNSDFELKDGTFIRVTSRERDEYNQEWIIGRRLVNQNTPGLLMPHSQTPKELVWISSCDNNANEFEREIRIPAGDARRKCKIIFTNVPHAMLNINHVYNAPDDLFFCRWQRMTTTERTVTGNQHKAGRTEVIDIGDTDVEAIELRHGMSQNARMALADVRRDFRGRRNCDLGGSTFGPDSSGVYVQKYTFADFFCGAGGASQGAHDAGLALRLALDQDEDAIRTYSLNFARPGLDIQKSDISHFIRKHAAEKRSLNVDILHVSPPCQPFSRANTIPNLEKNAMNQATLTTVSDILKICKPRIVTLEETDGMTDAEHSYWYQTMISYFIDHGYSVQWKVVDMKRYGVPQTRKRLILIAAGPGEKLPPFPAPTYGLEPGLRPLPTIGQAIRNIRYHPLLHNVANTWHFLEPRREIHPDGLSGTITCNGGGSDVYHPQGRRKYTMRELLALQTFPASFDFSRENPPNKTSMRRQIGNAVPPAFSRVLFETIRDWLNRIDATEVIA